MKGKWSHIPIEILRSFISVAETGSLSTAAEQRNLTQPAVSEQMKRLQQLCGSKLLVRTGRGVTLTESGQTVASYARRILSLNDQVLALAGGAGTIGPIRLGVQSIYAHKLLSRVAAELGSRLYEYYFACGSSKFLCEQIEAGFIDLAFMHVADDFRRNVIADWSENLVWVASPNFRLRDSEPIPLIIRSNGAIDRSIQPRLDAQKHPYRIVFNASNIWTTAAALEAGFGITALPERIVSDVSNSLVILNGPQLPSLPAMRVGVFHREGFDLEANRSLINKFAAAVQRCDDRAAA